MARASRTAVSEESNHISRVRVTLYNTSGEVRSTTARMSPSREFSSMRWVMMVAESAISAGT
jgi:hypothetical protein